MMKKMIHIAAAYLTFGLFAGLFYHEAAYYTGFTGESILSVVHTHAIALGALVFFVLPLFMRAFPLQKQKTFVPFVATYNVGLLMTLGFMSGRGVVQLFNLPISSFWDHMIGGLAGIGHVILTVGLYLLIRTLLKAIREVED